MRIPLHLLLLSLLTACPAAPAAEPVPINAFFDAPCYAEPRLSPSGKYLALRAGKPGMREFLAVVDLATGEAKAVAGYQDADIGRFQWVNDNRLLYDLIDRKLPLAAAEYANGLFAVNRDGSDPLQLADRTGLARDAPETGSRLPGRLLLPWNTYMLSQRGAQDSDYAYVQSVDFDTRDRARQVNLLRLNTVTGKSTRVTGPDGTHGWLLDQNGEPRIAITGVRDAATIEYLDPATKQWRVLVRDHAMVPGGSWVQPAGFGPDGTLYVAARAGKDTTALHSFDLAAGQVDPEPLFNTPGFDFGGGLITTNTKLLGLRFATDADSEEWIDPAMKAIQRQVDKLLPGTINLLSVPRRAETPWLLVSSFSDTIPATYLVYNSDSGELKKIGASHPAIDSRRMGHQQPVRYKTRDGLDMFALLTLPAGGRRTGLPLVVLVHGGPGARGSTWGWAPESQFLASRGYAVLEPEFRGSAGFGAKHLMAGWKQWGLKMQDDVADGARWAIAHGFADPRRICIAGASYGGYATLMGLVNDPDLYQCGIDWLGVTDINLMYTGTWHADSDLPDEWKRYGMPVTVGDPDKDAAQLKATSPIEQAARIRQPLLLAYGGRDQRVPIFHGEKFHDAVKKTNHAVEWVTYPEEGHGWALPETRIDFWTRVEKFLDKNIGKGAVQE